MKSKDILEHHEFWKQAYCAAIASGILSPEARIQVADNAVQALLDKISEFEKENEG